MSGPSRKRAHAKYATKHVAMAVLRSGKATDRFTFMKIVSERMDEKYKGADDKTQLAIYDVIWNFSQRIPRRSPTWASIQAAREGADSDLTPDPVLIFPS